MTKVITIATRQSQLALWQAKWAQSSLQVNFPDYTFELLGLTTQADREPYISLQEVGGKGLFVKELEEALLNNQADIAVHSMKDMPVKLPDGLCLPAMSKREIPWDVLVSNKYASVDDLPSGAIVGTSSIRRQSLLLHLRPDVNVKPLRGNVLTRLTRLDTGEYDAIILAMAGLKRLGIPISNNGILESDHFLPPAGQGVIGIECRTQDANIISMLKTLNDETAYTCVTAERALCQALGANCQSPLSAYADTQDGQLRLRALVCSPDGKQLISAQAIGLFTEALTLGSKVANALLSQGANNILNGKHA